MKRILSFAALLLLLVSCSSELEPVAEPQPQPKTAGDFVFYASFGDHTIPETKVFMNDSWQLRWNADDQISIFNKTADNLQFTFVGAEADALLADLTKRCERKDLKAAAVGQNGAFPVHKLPYAAETFYHFVARTKVEVVGVAQRYLTADLLQVERVETAFYGGRGGDVLKGGRFHRAVDRLEKSEAGLFFGFQDCKAVVHFLLFRAAASCDFMVIL